MLQLANEMTWTQMRDAKREDSWFILPISALEQHGPHLPLGTDDFILQAVLKRLLQEYKPQKNVFLLPTLPYGNSVEHGVFPGTVYLSCQTLVAVVEDVIRSLSKNGFRQLILVNSHGGNTGLLHAYAQQWHVEHNVRLFNIDFWGGKFFSDTAHTLKGDYKKEIHAGEIETSVVYHAYPQFQALQTQIEDVAVTLPSHCPGWTTEEISQNGTLGYASLWSEKSGEELLHFACQKMSTILDDLLSRNMPTQA